MTIGGGIVQHNHASPSSGGELPSRLVEGVAVALPVATLYDLQIDALTAGLFPSRVSLFLNGLASTNNNNDFVLQLGHAGGIIGAGYLQEGATFNTAAAISIIALATGIRIPYPSNLRTRDGIIQFTKMDATLNTWAWSAFVASSSLTYLNGLAGRVTLGAGNELSQIRITTIDGLATLSGSVNHLAEI